MHTQPLPSASRSSQEGSIVVILAITIGMLIALLGSIQIGYTAYQKRELQKTADMAALSAVQNLGTKNTDNTEENPSVTMARAIAKQNIKLADSDQIDPVPGKWMPAEDPDKRFVPTGDNPNAVEVTVHKTLPMLIPFVGSGDNTTGVGNSITSLKATAIAASSQPIASFTVGSRLLRLLGIPVLDSKGVISVSHLLKLLDLTVGSPDEILSLQTTVGKFLKATVTAVGENGTSADIQAADGWLSAVTGKIDPKITIPLFGPGGIFVLADTQDPQAALTSQVKVSDLANIGLTVANGSNLVNIPDLKLLGRTIVGKIRIIEPPTLAIGGKETIAYSAQVRIYLNISLDDKDNGSGILNPILPALGDLLGNLGTSINLKTIIDVASSRATLEELCSPADKDRAEFKVERSLAKICIGSFPNTDFFDPGNSCANVEPGPLIKILGLQINAMVPLDIHATSDIDGNIPLWKPYQADESKPSAITIPGQLNITNTVSSLIDGLLATLINTNIGSSTQDSIKTSLANSLLNAVVKKGIFDSKVTKSVSLLNEKLNTAQNNLLSLNLLGVVGNIVSGALSSVGSLLTGLLNGLGDLLTGCWDDTCKVGKSIDDNVTKTLIADSLVKGLLSPLDGLLSPLLQPVLLSITETDLSLNGLQCNAPMLVQ